MIRRTLPALLPALLLALCFVLTGLAGVVAQARMAAAGGYCGTGAPQILLDQAGLPVLDAGGAAIAAPDCPVCHLPVALTGPDTTAPVHPHSLIAARFAPTARPLSPPPVRLAAQARAPPVPA